MRKAEAFLKRCAAVYSLLDYDPENRFHKLLTQLNEHAKIIFFARIVVLAALV